MTSTVTVGEGATCVFVAVDHCTTELASVVHAAKRGTRFEALDALIRQVFSGQNASAPSATAVQPRVGCDASDTTTAPIDYLADGFPHAVRIGVLRGAESSPRTSSRAARRQWGRGAFHPARERRISCQLRSFETIAQGKRSRVAAFGIEFLGVEKNGHAAPFSWAV